MEKIIVNYINNILEKHGYNVKFDVNFKEITNGFEIIVKIMKSDKNGNNNK